jgi:hypothetical protein
VRKHTCFGVNAAEQSLDDAILPLLAVNMFLHRFRAIEKGGAQAVKDRASLSGGLETTRCWCQSNYLQVCRSLQVCRCLYFALETGSSCLARSCSCSDGSCARCVRLDGAPMPEGDEAHSVSLRWNLLLASM